MFQRFKRKKEEHTSAPAKQLVDGILSVLGFSPEKYALFEICDRETKAVVSGCETVALQGKRLCVEVPSAVHRQELYYSKKRIIQRVNAAIGRAVIDDIRFELKTTRQ